MQPTVLLDAQAHLLNAKIIGVQALGSSLTLAPMKEKKEKVGVVAHIHKAMLQRQKQEDTSLGTHGPATLTSELYLILTNQRTLHGERGCPKRGGWILRKFYRLTSGFYKLSTTTSVQKFSFVF